jgi:hypothetical protein
VCPPAAAKRTRRSEQARASSTTSVAHTVAQGSRDTVDEPQTIQDSRDQNTFPATTLRHQASNLQVPERQNGHDDLTFSDLQSMQMPYFNRATPLNDWKALVIAAEASACADRT